MDNKKIMIQISTGQGPEECELAVAKLFNVLYKEYPDIELIDKSPGKREGCFKSIRFYGGSELQQLDGTIQWICQSPFRPKHKRKNWFVNVSICTEANAVMFCEDMIRFETFRCSGKGGQHVNKTDSGIRAIYTPTGDSVVVMEERSQYANKQIAIQRLKQLITEENQENRNNAKTCNWMENYKIVRGNSVRVYEGMDFKLRG